MKSEKSWRREVSIVCLRCWGIAPFTLHTPISNLPLSAFKKRKYSSKQPPLNFKSTFFFLYPIGISFLNAVRKKEKISILKNINFLLPSTQKKQQLESIRKDDMEWRERGNIFLVKAEGNVARRERKELHYNMDLDAWSGWLRNGNLR